MFLDHLLSQFAPFECLGCHQEGRLLCSACSRRLRRIPSRCYRCHRLTETYRTCRSCQGSSQLYSVVPYTGYEGLAKRLIWYLKFQGAQAAAREMAAFITPYLPPGDGYVLVPVSTATSRFRKRGYDQAVLLARVLAQHGGRDYAVCLRRLGQHEQVGATRHDRLTQLAGAYRCVQPSRLVDKHVLLVDDVLTTGATLEAAARVVKTAGAWRVSALVFAQA